MLAITGASAALALSEIPFEKTIAGVRIGLRRRPVHRQPDLPAAQAEQARSRRRRQHGRPGDGRGRREGSDRGAGRRGARNRARRDQARSSPAIDDLAKEAGKKKLTVAKKEIGHDFYREVEEKVLVPLTEAMRIRGKLENYDTRRPGAQRISSASLPEGEVERKAEAKADLQGAEGESPARRSADARRPPRRPQVRRGPARSGSKPACCRAPTARPCSRAAKRRRSSPARSAPPTMRRRSRASRARRGRASCSTTTSRPSRSAKSAFMRGPGRREVGHGALAERSLTPLMPAEEDSSLHRPRRLGHPRIERLLVDGVGLRRIAGDDGRRRAAQERRSPASRWAW